MKIEKIIKGIYSKANSIDPQDSEHSARTFENKRNFQAIPNLRHIGISDIHQRLTSNVKYNNLSDVYYDFAYISKLQIFYATRYANKAMQFEKYVDDIFKMQLGEQIFLKVHNKLSLQFKSLNVGQSHLMQRGAYNQSADSFNNKSVITTAYKHAGHLFPANKIDDNISNRKNAINVTANPMNGIKRIISDDSDKPILSRFQSQQQQQTHTQTNLLLSTEMNSISPSVKSASAVTVTSNTSRNTKSSKTVSQSASTVISSSTKTSNNSLKSKESASRKLKRQQKIEKVPKKIIRQKVSQSITNKTSVPQSTSNRTLKSNKISKSELNKKKKKKPKLKKKKKKKKKKK